MTRSKLRRTLATALTVGSLLPVLGSAPPVRAASPHQSAPPGINAGRPTISGRLVAKATGKAAPSGGVTCGTHAAAPALMVNRGLVICTDERALVLLQLSRSTSIFNRDWQRVAYARLG